MNQAPHDPLAAVLTSARRSVDTEALIDDSADLARRVAAGPRRSRRPRRAVSIALAAVLVGAPTAAAAYSWTAHTGVFGDPTTSEEDASEWLDVCAPDFASTARTLAPRDLVLPPGATVDMAAEELWGTPDPACEGVGARRQADGIRMAYESWAHCSWVHTYVAEPSLRDEAARRLKQLANTPLLVAHDGGGTVEMLNELADAAAAGDVARVHQEQRVNCTGFGFGS